MAKVALTSKTSAMKSKSTLSLLVLAVIFASCTTAYQSGQTPDDVYFSPSRPSQTDEYVRQDRNDNKKYRYRNEEDYRDDRYLRMKIHDPRYMDLYEDYYSYNPYYYHYYNGRLIFNSAWTPYSYWSYYYNPYCHNVVTVVPKTPVYSRPRIFDLSVYNPQPSSGNSKGVRSFTNTNYNNNNDNNNYRGSGQDAGGFLRNIFGSGNNSGNSKSSSNTSSSSGNSSSSESSSGKGSNAPVRKF